MYWMSPALAIITLSNLRVYISLSDCRSILPKVKWVVNKGLALRALLGVPNVNSDY